ncbi:hypothetical protein RHGRI_007224 [Rhododendron griersonianum]|uniref:Uncharacterized protein n=1 Tax=Rhododendron griersonianum TaxID=479676 RepID=A0AAV6KW79_9ERIC|nr:hypothetical protein RHGRI_007224 [Rhododendron griersonianum]
MDLDDLDGQSRVPSRINRFAPKNSKLKAKSEPQELHSLPMKKKEEVYSIHDCETTNQDDCAMKMDVAVKMDVEAKLEGQETKDETMEEVDDDDRVVREIDMTVNYHQNFLCLQVRIKPLRADVEVDLSTDVDSKNYDTDADPRVRMTKQNKLPNDDLQESWMTLKYHSSKSDYSIRYLRKMEVEESAPIQFSMSPYDFVTDMCDIFCWFIKLGYDYVSSLCPGAFNDNMKSQGPSTRFLRSLPLEERFKIWFREGPPANRLRTLKKHLAPDDSIEDVLGVLQKLAHLVQGLWIPKTPLLLEGGVECLARDYFLLLFSKNPVISYEQVKAVGSRGQPLKDVIKGVLSILAVERPDLHGWKFKELPDVSSENESSDEMFMKLYSDVVKEQEKAWEHAEKPLTDSIFVGGRGGLKNSSKPDTANRAGTSKVQSKSAARSSNGAVSRTPMSNETREALPKVLQKLFQTHSVCSLQLICQRLREMAISESTRPKGVAREVKAAAIALDAPQEELLDLIGQVAINIHGVYVSKSSIDPQYDPLRNIVIDLLIAEGPNAKLKRAAIVEAAKMQLNQDISPNAYQKVLNELCVSQGSAWVLKRGDGNPK